MESAGERNYRKALALHEAGDFGGAVALYDAALRAEPLMPALHFGRGNSLVMLRRIEDAILSYDRSLALSPAHPLVLYNKARALTQLERWGDALAALDVLVGHHPAMADGWMNRAGVLHALGRHGDALTSLQHVLRLKPFDARVHFNIGNLLLVLNRFDEAWQAFARVRDLDPGRADISGYMATAALKGCDWDRLEQMLPELLGKVAAGNLAMPALTLMALSDDPALQKRCAEANLRQALADRPDGGSRLCGRTNMYTHAKIRIGYVSSDFREHPVATQIAAVLEKHDRTRFEIFGFFTGRDDGSALHRRIARACDRFFHLGPMGSREAAAVIRESEIDILVDLNGQTLGWRPAILQQRPAPVVASYLGYAGTMGADFVDYVIGDPHVTPFALSAAMSEKIVQLPRSFWPADPDLPPPEPVSRAELGLPDAAFVFCCFNAGYKIRPAIFDVWMRLLEAVPDSLLWLRDNDPAVNARLLQQAARRGLAPTRIHFAGRMKGFSRHLGRLAQADLFLDTWPYSAHATAGDALWAELPLVTLRGDSFASRVASGFLANLGLEELVAGSVDSYQAIALSLARDRQKLSDVRRRLRENRPGAAPFDVTLVTRHLELAYRRMVEQARGGTAPESFRVDPVMQAVSSLSP